MRNSRRSNRLVSLAEYLAFEEESSIRHEYIAGEVYAMSDATTRHNTISLNVHRHPHAPARRCGCRGFGEGIKLHVLDRVYSPAVMLACGGAAEGELMIEEPSLVVEDKVSPVRRLCQSARGPEFLALMIAGGGER